MDLRGIADEDQMQAGFEQVSRVLLMYRREIGTWASDELADALILQMHAKMMEQAFASGR